MKKFMLGLGLLLSAGLVNAQNGLESIIVEKYYVSNAVDAAGSVGTLPTGSVTYRFYVDMLPGYKFQAAYGAPAGNDVLTFSTTTSFFNNEDRGAVTPSYTKTQARGNSVMLDSWLSVGAGCAANYGILKSEDDGVANVVNNSSPIMLQNNDASAGIPLTTQDGLIAGTPQAVTTVGQTDGQATIFDATSQAGSTFTLTDGAWSALSGATGPTASNRVLIAQLTTDGILTYALNIQIGTPTSGVQRYVHDTPNGTEVDLPSLSGTLGAPNTLPTVSITSPTNGQGFITGSTINIAATAADANGTVASVAFFNDGVLISTDNTAPYQASYTGTTGTDVLTAVVTDNEGATVTSAGVTINIASNPPPSVAITAPTAGASFITGDVVNIAVTATDNGSVTGVEFFVDGNLLSTDNTAPYTATYTSTLGGHSLTARATDNAGLQATSAAVSISVVNNIPPTAALTSPAAGSLFTAPAVVAISANASDADGTVTQVEFLVNNVSIGVDNTSPYSINWTSVIGNASIVARSTDNRGAVTASAAVVLSIADPNALPYNIGSSVNVCNDTAFCLPLNVVDTVANIIGYDVVLNFDPTRVTPTGVVTVGSDLVNPSLTEVSNSIDQVNGVMNISVYFNGSAPAATRFAGAGELFCVQFTKNAAFAPNDTANFTVPFLQESFFTGVQSKLVQTGDYVSYRDSLYTGTLKLWSDNSRIPYNVANPNQFLITNVRGTAADCSNPSVTAVQPDLNGVFTYSAFNGLSINIDKDILGTTDVQAVINGQDALLARRVLINDITLSPSVYQIVAMDVNLDGTVSAGDVSQINQRAVLFIPEFKQAWNYDINGVSNGSLSKDWLFVDSSSVSTPAYVISSTYPADNGTGFSKSRVPSVDFCLPIKVTSFANCPDYTPETYVGILVGDVNGNVATANPSAAFKSATEKVIFDLNRAVYSAGSVEVPVTVMSVGGVNAVDFSMNINENKLSFVGMTGVASNLESLSHFNADDRKVRFTANGIESVNTARPVAFVKFNMNGAVDASDLMNAFGYINGNQAEVEVIGNFVTGISANDYNEVVAVFPNPASNMVNVIAPEATTISMMDAAGRVISAPVSVSAGQTHSISTSEFAAGVYFVKISNNNFSVMKKVVVNK